MINWSFRPRMIRLSVLGRCGLSRDDMDLAGTFCLRTWATWLCGEVIYPRDLHYKQFLYMYTDYMLFLKKIANKVSGLPEGVF